MKRWMQALAKVERKSAGWGVNRDRSRISFVQSRRSGKDTRFQFGCHGLDPTFLGVSMSAAESSVALYLRIARGSGPMLVQPQNNVPGRLGVELRSHQIRERELVPCVPEVSVERASIHGARAIVVR